MTIINDVTNETKFRVWKDITNEIKTLALINESNIVSLNGDISSFDSRITINEGNITTLSNDLITLDGRVTTNEGNITTLNNDVSTISNNVGDITTLTTTDQTNTVNAINEIDADVVTLDGRVTTNESEIGDITTLTTIDKTNVVNAINEIDLQKVDINQAKNNEVNSGRFFDESGISPSTKTSNSGIFSNYNSSSLSNPDTFINGSGGGGIVTDLLSELVNVGRQNATSGIDFSTLKLTIGSGTGGETVDINVTTYYQQLENLELIAGRIGEFVTWAGWVRHSDSTTGANPIILGDGSSTNIFVDGIEISNKYYELIYNDGWKHIKMTTQLTNEFISFFPKIFGLTSGTEEMDIALPALFNGDVNIKPENHLGVIV